MSDEALGFNNKVQKGIYQQAPKVDTRMLHEKGHALW